MSSEYGSESETEGTEETEEGTEEEYAEESSEPSRQKRTRRRDDSSEEDSYDESGREETENQAPIVSNAPYGGSKVLQRIMARRSKWDYRGKDGDTDDENARTADEDSKKAKGKASKKTTTKKTSTKGSKKGKPGSKKKSIKKQPDPVVSKVLERTDPGFHEIHSHFMEHHDPTTEVETILDVFNPDTWKQFTKYRDGVAKKRPYFVRNNILTQRVYHGTFLRCELGLDGKTKPCKHADCRVCQIIRNGFSLDKFGKGARKPADAKGIKGYARFGKGLYFSDWASKSQEYATAFANKAGKRGRTAVLACQVVTGLSKQLWDYDGTIKAPPKGFDSVKGEVADAAHPFAVLRFPETVVYNEAAAVVTQVIIYSHNSPMCPNCGIQVDFEEKKDQGVKDEYGWFCTKECNQTFRAEIEEFEATIRDTPADIEDPGTMPFWEQTTSDENCDLIPLWAGSKEGSLITVKMKTTMPHVTIHKMFRVQNRFLHERYVEELRRVVSRNGGIANEQLLWHGTRATPPDEIFDTDEGFDFRFASSGMWGRGSYFAVNSSYSDDYAYQEANGYKTMFLAKVCLGDFVDLQPDNSLNLPPQKPAPAATTGKKGKRPKRERYDSVTGMTNGSRVHIVYAPAKAYPAYLVTYSGIGFNFDWNF